MTKKQRVFGSTPLHAIIIIAFLSHGVLLAHIEYNEQNIRCLVHLTVFQSVGGQSSESAHEATMFLNYSAVSSSTLCDLKTSERSFT